MFGADDELSLSNISKARTNGADDELSLSSICLDPRLGRTEQMTRYLSQASAWIQGPNERSRWRAISLKHLPGSKARTNGADDELSLSNICRTLAIWVSFRKLFIYSLILVKCFLLQHELKWISGWYSFYGGDTFRLMVSSSQMEREPR
jgi:hypothetical protein